MSSFPRPTKKFTLSRFARIVICSVGQKLSEPDLSHIKLSNPPLCAVHPSAFSFRRGNQIGDGFVELGTVVVLELRAPLPSFVMQPL